MKNIELGKSVTMPDNMQYFIDRINSITPNLNALNTLHVNLHVMIVERIEDEINFQLYLIKNREDFDRKLPEE